MALFGGGSSDQADNRRVIDNAGEGALKIGAGDEIGLNNATINMLDGGAIDGAMRVADRSTNRAIQGMMDGLGQAFQFGESTAFQAFDLSKSALENNKGLALKAMDQSERATKSALEKVYQSSQPDKSTQDQLIKGAMIVLGIGAVAVAVGALANA